MSPSYFPDTQTLTMQQEALRRVREMQLRARQSVEQSNAFPDAPHWQSAPTQSAGAPVQPQFQAQPTHQPSFGQQFQQAAPPQGNMQQGFAPQNMPQGAQQAAAPNNMRSGVQRQSPIQSNNILAHLFGGGRQTGPQNQSGGPRGPSQGGNQSAPRPGAPGLLDMLRKQGIGDSLGGLGETLQSTISSVSEPLSGLLDTFGIDGEKLVILLVMWVIFSEHKDNKTLLMALGYLLL